MIEARPESLNLETQDKIRRLLNGEMFNVLLRLGESQIKLLEAKALTDSVEAAKGAPLKFEAANESLRKAARFANFCDVLTEFKQQKTPFVTVKLS
jgi:hypothetical protein